MRCYNGCPDDELRAVWESRIKAKRRATKLGYVITYFPAEEKWAAAFKETWESVGPFCDTAEECLTHVLKHYDQRRQAFLAQSYGAGDIRVGLITGEYPPKDYIKGDRK